MSSQWQTKRCPVYGCELWQGRTDSDGYGLVWNGRERPKRAHRLAWEQAHGPIGPGLEVDHLCRRRACVAVAHLELATRTENERRKQFKRRIKATHCKAGHELFLHGRLTEYGGRICRVCSGV